MDIRRQKALEFASDLTKQLMTLSTGILTITIAFSKDIIKAPTTPRSVAVLLMLAWPLYLLSVICGIWNLMALTGELEPRINRFGDAKEPEPTTKGSNVFWPTVLQIGTFLLGTILMIAFGVRLIW